MAERRRVILKWLNSVSGVVGAGESVDDVVVVDTERESFRARRARRHNGSEDILEGGPRLPESGVFWGSWNSLFRVPVDEMQDLFRIVTLGLFVSIPRHKYGSTHLALKS
jgi:hypothetical protein